MNPLDKRWYYFDDERVKEFNIENKKYETNGSSTAYILIYSKKSLI